MPRPDLAQTLELLQRKASELDASTDELTADIRYLSHRLAETHATTTVWLATAVTEDDPDLPGYKFTWMVGYAGIRSKINPRDPHGPKPSDGRIWCLCAKRLKVDGHGTHLDVVRTCTLDSAPRHVRAAAVAVLPKLIKDLYYTVELHAASIVRAAEAMKALNAGKEA